jgi:hypothetical protein
MPNPEDKNKRIEISNPNIGTVENNLLNPDSPSKKEDVKKSEEDIQFFKELNEKKKKIQAPNTFATGNITGITSANQRIGKTPQGHYESLHEDVGIDLFSTPENWEKLGYNQQSNADIALNSFLGFLNNAAAGFLEGVAGNDPQGLYNMSMGNTEERYGNILHDWANNLLEYTDENLHIYDDGSNSPFSFNYWGRQMQSFGYSVGIIGEMFAEAALLKKASGSSLKLLSKGSKFASNPVTFGSFQGIKEAYLNGLQTGEQTYLKYKDMGYTEQEAKQKGNEAATLGFRMEVVPLMAMNSLQFASLSKYNPFMKKGPNLGFSGGFETLSDYAFKKVNNKYLKKIADYGTNMVAEAIEEGIQTGIAKEAQYQLELADGLVNKKTLDERLFDDDEMRDSMIGGALGGGTFRFMGKRFNTLTQGTEIKRQQAEYDKYLTGVAQRVNEDTAELQQAIEDNDLEKVDVIRKRMQRSNVLEALQYDLMNQDEKAFDTYMSSLQQIKEAVASGDTETMEKFGITTSQDVDAIASNIDTYIEDANNVKQKLVDALNTTDDVSAAIQIADSGKTLEELNEFEKRSDQTIADYKAKDSAYNAMTEKGKRQFDLMTERAALITKAKHNSITAEQKARIEEINKELESIKSEGKYEGQAKDNSILNSINGTNVIKELINKYEMQDYQEIVSDRLAYWNDKKNQRQERIKKAKKRVSKAKKKESLEKAKEELRAEESLTPEVEEKINAKIEKAEVKDLSNNGKIDEPFGKTVRPSKEELETAQENKEKKADNTTPFGTVVTPTVEDLKTNPEREAKADQIVKDLGIEKKGDSVIVNNDDLFEPAPLGGFTEAQLNKLKDHVADYHASLKEELKAEPTFEDFIRDFIKNNTKEATDRIYNALIEGWKANGFPTADYDAVYNKIFRDRKEMSSDILNVAEDMIENESDQKVKVKNEDAIEKAVKKKSPTVALDNNNRPIIKDSTPYRTVSPELKAAHLSIPYKREIITTESGEQIVVDTDISEDLNSASDIKSQKLLNPNEYGIGTELSVKIPTNYKEIKVSTWVDDFTKGPSMTFGEWEKLPGNQKYINKAIRVDYSKPYVQKNDGSGLVKVETKTTEKDGIVKTTFTTYTTNKKGEVRTQGWKSYNNIEEVTEEFNIDWEYQVLGETEIQGETLEQVLETNVDAKDFIGTLLRDNPKLKPKVVAVKQKGNKVIVDLVIQGNTISVIAPVQETSTEKQLNPTWVQKVPMVAVDSDGDSVFFVHSNDWYNPINVGFKDDLQKQSEVIEEAHENLNSIRNTIVENGSQKIVITNKRPGTFKTINKDQPALTLNQANPQTQLGIANDQGEIVVNGKQFETEGKVLINEELFQRGHTYDIRQTGKNEYIALKVLRDKITPEVVESIQKAAEVYLFKHDDQGLASDQSLHKQIRKEVLNHTGLDLYKREDFEEYLNLFMPTVRGKFSGTQDISNSVEANAKIAHGTPYFAIQSGSLVFGVKGHTFAGENKVLYIHPRKVQDKGGPVQMKGMLTDFAKILPKVTQNISKNGLSANKTVALINSDGVVSPKENYENFLKNSLRTNVRSFNVGTKSKPVYATIVQPVITYKAVENAEEKAKAEGKPNTEIVEETATKIVEETPLNKVESATSQMAADKVQATAKEKYEAKKVDEIETLKNTLESLRELGVPEDDPSLVYVKERLGKLDDSDYAPIAISDDLISEMKEDTSGIEGLSILQDFQLVDYIFNEITAKLDFKHKAAVDKNLILKEIKNAYFELIEPKKLRTESTISNLKKLNAVNPNERMTALINKMETEVEVFNKIKDNWKDIQNKALDKVFKYTGIQESRMEVKEVADASTEQEKNYSKSSLEENGKTTASYRLKRFFSGVKQVDASGKVKTGFLGVETYVGFDTVYSTIEQIISSPYEVDSNFNDMIVRLEENMKSFPWLRQVIDQLNVADGQIKNEFVYNFARHTLSMKFVMFSKNRDNTYTLKVYDTNANEITRVIRQQWESNFKQSPLTYVEDGVYKINKEKAKILSNKFNEWSAKFKANPGTRKQASTVDIDTNEIINWLADFGISLSTETVEEMKRKPMTVMTKDGPTKVVFSKMFEKSSTTAGVFGLLADYLDNIVRKEDTTFEENPDNHPFNNANNVLKVLARIESKYSTFATTNSFRDGDKSIYGFTPTKHTTDVAKQLKYNQDFRNQLLDKSFNKHAFMLNLLNTDQAFAEKFYIDHLGITSLKELGKKVFGDNSIAALSDSDHELTKLGLFQDLEQGEVKGTLGKDGFVGLRMARMFMPTMSDKSQMLMMNTAVLDLTNKHFNVASDNIITMQEPLVDILYEQLVKPELERMYNFASTIKKTNIKDYDMAAQMFLMVPEMNNLRDKETNKRAISLIANAPETYTMDWFEATFQEKIRELLQNMIASEVNNKLAEWDEAGFFTVNEENKVTETKFLNKKYLQKFQGEQMTRLKLAANDFVINSMLSNANIFMMIAGDIAMYSQGKINKYFQDGKAYLPKEDIGDHAYAKAVKEIIGVNVGKRLALMLAPGNKLANSKGAKYAQIFMNDHIDISANVEALVKIFYTDEDVKYVKSRIKDYNASKESTERQAIAKELSARFPEIAEYFEIEATDAQEYTTSSEHINVLYGQGRLSSEQYQTIMDKVNMQKEAEKEGKKIPESAMLNYSELALVLQPVKPVHTGFKNEDRFDAMRMMYIKTSSFPLIPQVTKGTELDKLRKQMEDFEAVKGMPVRASYQSGNKVGAVTTAITPFNPDGTYNDKINIETMLQASLTLDRNNFRIQQDVPFKSDKRKEDVVSLGTQTLKLLFGDGMLDLDGFVFEGETLTGKELQEKFNENFEKYIQHKKKVLYNQLGVDENGQPIDVEVTMNKLQELLKREAIERGYPKQDVEALKLTPTVDSTGKITDVQFSVPLWLSPNSNRYESLLNAIVTNKLVNLKIPGNSFVVGSEAGFKMQDDFSGVDQSRIVYTSAYTGQIEAAEFNEDGSLKRAQIMVPSKFRDNQGNLIQLIDEKGKPNPIYAERDENGVLRLKEEAIASELLNITSFRIPTSAHVSMSQLEIVGFLPTEVGDLMIVPRNLTKQKGLDFDVDKETTYQLHTFTNEDGTIKVLTEDDRQAILKIADAKNTADWNDGSPESNLLKSIFGEDPDFILEEIEEGTKLEKINDKIDQKLLENAFVKAHSAVLNNPNKEVQKKINKVLSMDFAKAQAELVQKVTEANVDNTYFSMLSDNYQKNKMFLGASGKLGIGVYSNYVVFHSMSQQAVTPLQLQQLDEEGKPTNFKLTIGKYTTDGTLGRQTSLATGKLSRNIAEAFAERQNTATDNEKEQIMGRLNVNEVTINVDSLMTALGFDKDVLDDGTEVSIPYLLLSQPIIKDFVKEIRKTRSNTTEYNPAAEFEITMQLYEKYGLADEMDTENFKGEFLTGQTLYDNLTTPLTHIQVMALSIFKNLDQYAKTISGVQNRLNINNQGLGKSFFDVLDKYQAIQTLPEETIAGVNGLVGEYHDREDLGPLQEEILLKEGAVKMGNYIIKPTTPVGSMLVHSVNAGYNLWSQYFPYDDIHLNMAMNQILGGITSESTSAQKRVQLKQDIFKEFKKYLVSSQKLGVFEGDPQVRRKELFIDTEENTSLANYLRSILEEEGSSIDFLKSNKLISRFQYDVNANGLPSTIKFDNTKGENFDEDYLYMALIEMMEENRNLPERNGESYTTRQLAQDLIAYTYLEGGVQEAIQFAKYIPISYLNAIPFGDSARKWNNNHAKGIFASILGLDGQQRISRFTRQYIQHNPQRLPKLDPKLNLENAVYTKGNDLKTLVSFEINEDTLSQEQLFSLGNSDFVAIYNPGVKKGLKKFQVYENIDGVYHRISSLGVFGMSEYSIRDNEVTSLVNDKFRAKSPSKPLTTTKSSNPDIFGVQTSTVQEVINNIANYDFKEHPHLKNIAQAVQSYVDGDLSIQVADLVNERGDRIARGRHKDGKITIDTYYFSNASNEDLAKTILHEVIHGLTTDYVSKYVDTKGNYLVAEPPAEIINLVRLFNETKNKLGKEVEAYLEKRQKQLTGETREGSTEREITVAYAGTNVREFITLVMTEPNFQEEMKNVKYKETNDSLWDRFTSLVNDILFKIFGPDYETNGVTAAGIKNALTIIEKQAEQKAETKREAMEANDRMAEELLNTPFGDVIMPTDEELGEMGEDLEKSDDSPTFENPFKCK